MSKVEKEKTEIAEQKIGLERFLQLNPQKRGVTAVIRSKYAAEIHTETEWKALITQVLNRKVR